VTGGAANPAAVASMEALPPAEHCSGYGEGYANDYEVKLSPGEHFLDALIWSWRNAWSFAEGRLWWSLPIALVAAVIIGVLTRPTGAITRTLWPQIRNGVIAAVLSPIIVVSAVFLYSFVILYPLDQDAKINSRLSDLEKKLPAAATPDQRIDILQQRLAKVEQTSTSQSALIEQLLRLAFLEGCERRLAGVEDQFDHAAEQARNLIGIRGGGPLGGRMMIQQTWDNKLAELKIIAKQCSPSMDSRLEPTEDQIHNTKTEDEPSPNADPDLIYNVRKFNLRKVQAISLISKLKAAVATEITNLRYQAAQNIGQP
jgi:hypothetical protein